MTCFAFQIDSNMVIKTGFICPNKKKSTLVSMKLDFKKYQKASISPFLH